MIALLGKALIALFEHELKKEEPQIEEYLIKELRELCDHLDAYLEKKAGSIGKGV